jgi:hypothetical protein
MVSFCELSEDRVPSDINYLYQTHKKYKFNHHLGFQLKFTSFFSRIPIRAFELT